MKYKEIKLCLFLFGIGLSGLKAQEAIPATGGNVSGYGGSVSYSVGQLVTTTNTGTNGSAAQGVQQPFEISIVTGIDESIGINLNVMAYPNPTTDLLTLSVDHFEQSNLAYQLYDQSGKLLENKILVVNQTGIAMSNYTPATYLLKIMENNKEVKTFKIIKN
jgi:hypothetical protein